MRTMLLATALAGAAFVSAANAQYGTPANSNFPFWYVGVHGEMGYVQDADVDVNGVKAGEIDNQQWGAGVSLGYRPYNTGSFLDNSRMEIEYTYRDLEDDADVNAYMFNYFYDFRSGSKWTPYLGAGIGMATVDIDADDDDVLAYQGMLGITYAPDSLPNTEWGIGYRYFGAQSTDYSVAGADVEVDSLNTHNAEINAKFRF